jgi:D-psicose/D-tagatose/L-ribulose 3-epimerase
MKYGMNLLLWSGEVTDDLLPVCEQLKAAGYEGVELPMFNLDLDYAALGKKLDDLGLARTAVTIRNEPDNPISPDKSVRDAGVALTCKTLDCCAAAGVETLIGPYHSAIGVFSGAGPTQDEWKWGVESMQRVAEHAAKVNVKLGVESLNRFECYFLNTIADATRFAHEVDNDICGVMYDTFHSNIEEKCIAGAIQAAGDKLCHVHISENDRSTPGEGIIRWKDNFDALVESGYDGWLVVEAFGTSLPEIAAATKIWRKMYPDEMTLAKNGLAFMKSEIEKRTS